MAIGTPVQLTGTSAGTNSGSAAATTTTVDAPIGSLIVVAGTTGSINCTLTGLTDSAGNTYAIVQASAQSLNFGGGLQWVITSVDVPSGSSFTATTSSGQWYLGGSWKVSGAQGGIDKSFSGTTNNVANISQATGTLASASQIIFGHVALAVSATITESTGFTNLIGAGASGFNSTGYDIVSATTTVTYNPSWTPNEAAQWALLSFQASVVGTGWEQQGALLVPSAHRRAGGVSPR